MVFSLLPAVTRVFAADGLDSGDTAWMIVSTALVMMMTPAGLALFYGGMSRYKNLLNTFAMTIVAYCLGSIVWVMWGYTLAFGPDKAGIIGGLDYLFLSGIGVDSLSGTIPTLCIRSVSDDFCRNHRGAGSRRHRRPDEIFGLDRVYLLVVDIHLRPDCALGMGRRLDGKNGRA